jgi:pantothenate synthetase
MERHFLEDLNVDIRIILKWIFKEQDGIARSRLIWLRTVAIGEFF